LLPIDGGDQTLIHRLEIVRRSAALASTHRLGPCPSPIRVADGAAFQLAGQRALKAGNEHWIRRLALAAAFREHDDTTRSFDGYYTPI